ncbi:MAG TPA: GntR family transcriptional regulator [Candidatus Acidoferrales bacterium]
MSLERKLTRKSKANSRARSGSIREKAYLHIQTLIANGTLATGGGISELLLAKELQSSRAPIREAMHRLAAEGLLEQNPSGGMVVAQLSRDDIAELYELREALEVFAVGKTARTAMALPDKQRLQHLVDEIGRLRRELEKSGRMALDARQMERFIACDLGFHALLISMANNSRLHKIVNETRLLIRVFAIYREGHDRDSLKSIQSYHQKILDSVIKQQPKGAMAALGEHIQASQRERLSEFDRWKRENSLRLIPGFFHAAKTARES